MLARSNSEPMVGAELLPTYYTFENVRAVGRAIASYVINNEDPKKGLVVGYDTRFGSKSFAEAISEEARRRRSVGATGQRLHAYPRNLLRGEEPEQSRWRRDYQQPQSLVVERGQIQGIVRRFGNSGTDQDHRAGTLCRRCAQSAWREIEVVDTLTGLHLGNHQICRSERDREGRLSVCHRLHVRRRP